MTPYRRTYSENETTNCQIVGPATTQLPHRVHVLNYLRIPADRYPFPSVSLTLEDSTSPSDSFCPTEVWLGDITHALTPQYTTLAS